MTTSIALLRGINVGGKNTLAMKELVSVLQDLGLTEIKTYLQSGNVVFRAPGRDVAKLSRAISAAIDDRFGFAPDVLILTLGELEDAIAANPFPEGEDEPKSLHLYFLAAPPKHPDLARLDALRTGTESFQLQGKLMYLHAPDGIGRSRLAAQAEKALGEKATARNWRTVTRLQSMAVSP